MGHDGPDHKPSPYDAAVATTGFDEDGVLVLRQAVTDRDLLAAVRADHDHRWPRQDRVQDGWRRSAAIRRLAADPGLRRAAAAALGGAVVPFQTLNLRRGTGQPLHADTVHFDTLPHGGVCGAWVALEDVGSGQGPVGFVRGSHRRPPVVPTGSGALAAHERLESERWAGTEPEPFLARAGDVLVWHGDLVHGGLPVLDPGSTRWSQVTHYLREGAVYVTPARSDPRRGEWWVREGVVDVATGRAVPQLLDGRPLRLVRIGGGRSTLLRMGDPPPGVWTRAASAARGGFRGLRQRVASRRP